MNYINEIIYVKIFFSLILIFSKNADWIPEALPLPLLFIWNRSWPVREFKYKCRGFPVILLTDKINRSIY